MFGKAVEFVIVHATIIVPAVIVLLLVWSRAARAAASFVLRMIARPLLLVAVVALVYDGTRTLAGGSGLVITSLVEHWQNLSPATFEALKVLIVQRAHPQVWDGALLRLFKLPAWLVIGVFGMLLAWIGRKRRNVNVFIN